MFAPYFGKKVIIKNQPKLEIAQTFDIENYTICVILNNINYLWFDCAPSPFYKNILPHIEISIEKNDEKNIWVVFIGNTFGIVWQPSNILKLDEFANVEVNNKTKFHYMINYGIDLDEICFMTAESFLNKVLLTTGIEYMDL